MIYSAALKEGFDYLLTLLRLADRVCIKEYKTAAGHKSMYPAAAYFSYTNTKPTLSPLLR